MKSINLSLLIILSTFMMRANDCSVAHYVDPSLSNKSFLSNALLDSTVSDTYHLFSHGRSGELLLGGNWLSGDALSDYLINQLSIIQYSNLELLNIYGCEFAKGNKGKTAVQQLQETLGIKVAASTNITGKDGDWHLEIGKVAVAGMEGYAYNLQARDLTTDTDGDGVLDIDDIDDDNDGILDNVECGNSAINTDEFSGTFGTILSGNRDLQSSIVNYTYGGNGIDPLDPEQRYVVSSYANSTNLHSIPFIFSNIYGHTTGTSDDAYLAVNGALAPNVVFYEQIVNVTPNKIYNLSVWGINANKKENDFPANILIRALDAADNVIASATTGELNSLLKPNDLDDLFPSDWTQASALFNSGVNTTLTIQVLNITGEASANDFLIDDISIQEVLKCDRDTDGDGLPNSIDPDSDNDGCPDVYDGRGVFTGVTLSGTLNDGPPPFGTGTGVDVFTNASGDVDAQGVPTIVFNTIGTQSHGIGNSQNGIPSKQCLDTDGDGVVDVNDIDDDNDGILDDVECDNSAVNTNEFSGTFGTIPSGNRDLQSSIVNYTYGGNGIDPLDPEQRYVVSSYANSTNLHSIPFIFSNIYGHTTGTSDDAYLAVNGAIDPDVVFYEQIVNVTPNKIYNLSVWGINANKQENDFPANILIRALNTAGNIVAEATTGELNAIIRSSPSDLLPSDWTEASILFNSGTNTTLTVQVLNKTGAAGANDFLIDDISLLAVLDCGRDTDGDGLPNSIDPDSDNDGCPDALDGLGVFSAADLKATLNDGPPPNGSGTSVGIFTNTDVDGRGLPNVVANNPLTKDGQGLGNNQNSGVQSDDCCPECFLGSLTITKEVVNPVLASACPAAGDTVSFRFRIENTNNSLDIPLSDVKVSNTLLNSGNPINVSSVITLSMGDTNQNKVLDVGEIWIYDHSVAYALSQSDINAATITSDTEAIANYGSSPVSEASSGLVTTLYNLTTIPGVSPSCFNGSMTLVKTGVFEDRFDSNGCADLDDVIVYLFEIKNTSSIDLNTITYTDPLLGITTPIAVPGATTLSPGASVSFTAEYTLQLVDLSAGDVSNTATAFALESDGVTSISAASTDGNGSSTTDVILPCDFVGSLTVTKEGVNPVLAGACPAAGDKVTFRFRIENTSLNAPLSNVNVSNTLLNSGNPINVSSVINIFMGDTGQDGVLGVGEVWTYDHPIAYTFTQQDINAAAVESSTVALANYGSSPVSEASSGIVSGSYDLTTIPGVSPTCFVGSMSLVKTGVFEDRFDTDGCPDLDDVIVYSFEIKNTSFIDLNTIMYTDPLLGITAPIAVPGATTLAPNQSVTFTAEYTLQSGDLSTGMVSNTASAFALEPDGVTSISAISTDANSNSTTEVILPCNYDVRIIRTVSNMSPNTGDDVIYTVLVENIGGIPATNIMVQDIIGSGLTFIGIEQTPSIGSTLLGTNTIDWSIPSLNFGESTTLIYRVNVNGGNVVSTSGYESSSEIISSSESPVYTDSNPSDNIATVTLTPTCLRVYNLISPNNDGDNDELMIDCIGDYPGHSIQIYNRWGSLIYETQNYDNPLNRWNGQSSRGGIIDIDLGKTSNGVPSGTYYYILDLNNGEEPLTGWIYSETPQAF